MPDLLCSYIYNSRPSVTQVFSAVDRYNVCTAARCFDSEASAFGVYDARGAAPMWVPLACTVAFLWVSCAVYVWRGAPNQIKVK